MAAISIRDLDDRVRDRLRIQAAEHGRSMESEIRFILTAAVGDIAKDDGLAQALLTRFGDLGGVELAPTLRTETSRAVSFDQ